MPEADRPELQRERGVVVIPDDLYDHTVAEHGVADARALCIPDHATHVQRLQEAAGMINLFADNTTLLDVGCGKGDLLNHTWLDYTGIEPCLPLVTEARRRWPDHRFFCTSLGKFAEYEPDATYDVVSALGVLVTIPPHQVSDFTAALKRRARRYVVVSFIPYHSEYKGRFYTHTPEGLASIGHVILSSTVAGEVTQLMKVQR